MVLEKQSQHGTRLHLLFLLLFIGLVIILLRLSFVQLGRGEQYAAQAEANRYAQQILPAPRGQFLDRNKEIIVSNRPSFTIQYTNPLANGNRIDEDQLIGTLADKLISMLEDPTDKEKLKREDLIAIMKGEKDSLPRSAPRKLKINSTDKQVAMIREHLDELPGIAVIPEAIRDYRLKTFASHMIGYMNSITVKTWPNYRDKGYLMTDRVGITGLEAQYESYLKGTHGATRVEVNIHGDPVRMDKDAIYVEKKPIPGNDLILTIDKKLQQATESSLAERVTALQKNSKVRHAAAVAMDPNTGEVLAMASYPPFDPNHWLNGISDENYELFKPAEFNHAVEYPYEPGSTVKMLTTMIGLKEGVMQPDEKVLCLGSKNIAGYTALDWKHEGHGWVDGRRAIAESCNIYMYTVGMRLSHHEKLGSMGITAWMENYDKPAVNKLRKYQNEFGLGVKTGIDLPFESNGKYNYFDYAATNMPFSAIGQNSNFTTLQLAQYVSTIANGGKRMRPYLVQEIVDPNGKMIKRTQPEVLNTVSFNKEELQYAKEGMWAVTHETYGTASYTFAKKPYKVAGKTGTSETGRNTENYWFVGFAPYDNPKIAIAVVVPDGVVGAHSYEMAGPIAEKMLDTFFDVPPKEEPAKTKTVSP